MNIASQKRKENIAEYLLYMWQVEDLIRANDLDLERIDQTVISRFGALGDEERRQMRQWYESLIEMMRLEGVKERGHLQINRNMMGELAELHKALLADPRFADYHSLYYKTLPYIVELRARAGENVEDEIATCFTALYGMLMLRLQRREVSGDTTAALKQITALVSSLASYFHKNEEKPLFQPADDALPV